MKKRRVGYCNVEKGIWPIVVFLYLLLTLVLNYKIINILLESKTILMIPENAPLSLDNYFKYEISDFNLISYRYIFGLIGKIFGLSLSQIIVLERISIMLLAFFGGFTLSTYYIRVIEGEGKTKCNKLQLMVIASFLGGMLYAVNPSFIIGDSFWIGIEFAYATLPWILWAFIKSVLESKIKYTILGSFLIALNVDEHFLWAGFPIILFLHSILLILLYRTNMEKKEYIKIFINLLLMLIISISIWPYRILVRLSTVSPYELSITKSGVDIPWEEATILNMLRAMSHMSLSDIYNVKSSFFYSLNNLMSLTLLIPIIASIALIFYKRNWIVIFYGILYTISILPFFKGSLFKSIHYWLFFHTPIGPAFRTWRVPDAYIALALTILTSLSIYYVLQYLARFSNKVKTISALLFIAVNVISYVTYSWPLLSGDINGLLTPIAIPDEYIELQNFLSSKSESFRVVIIPEFEYSYGRYSILKPFWSSMGAIQEILIFLSSKTVIYGGLWNHFYYFTVSPLYNSLIKNNETAALATFLAWINVRYVVVHDDIPSIHNVVKEIINNLNKSRFFELIFYKGFIYIFENKLKREDLFATNDVLLVDGGYRVLAKFCEVYYEKCLSSVAIFVDQKILPEILNNIKIILTDKPTKQLVYDVSFAEMANKHKNQTLIIYPYDYVTDYDPRNKWSRASYLDPHQQVWHPNVNWQDYAWDFDYMKGIIFTINSSDSLTIPFIVDEAGEYVMMLRLLKSDQGGEIIVKVDNTTYTIRTLDGYNGFLWHVLELYLSSGKHNITIMNVKGFNAISVIAIIPREIYLKSYHEILEWLSTKVIVNLDINLFKNPLFENGLNVATNYNYLTEYLKYLSKFFIEENETIKIEYYKINPTLWRVQINTVKPFMLIFTESYDPLWEANVYRDGRLIERVKPVPVYGVVNGFWINEAGNLTVVIRYIPQDWYEFGLKISGSTSVLCIFYLVWDWRRGRGDRWALIIERIFKKYLSKMMSYLRR